MRDPEMLRRCGRAVGARQKNDHGAQPADQDETKRTCRDQQDFVSWLVNKLRHHHPASAIPAVDRNDPMCGILHDSRGFADSYNGASTPKVSYGRDDKAVAT